jgi:hypothetical protein
MAEHSDGIIIIIVIKEKLGEYIIINIYIYIQEKL